MAAAALSRIAKTRWAADKEEGGKIVWCWKIKGRGGGLKKKRRRRRRKWWLCALKNFLSHPATRATCSNGSATSSPLGTAPRLLALDA